MISRHWRWGAWVLGCLLGLALGGAARPAGTQSAITITDRGAKITFPDRVIFTAQVRGDAPIDRVTLEYGTESRSCGTVIGKAFPSLTPGPMANVTWTWEMLKSGTEPPGALIWYRWRAHDSAGHEGVSERQTVRWLDAQHPWTSRQQGQLTLHWYRGTAQFADTLLQAGATALTRWNTATGLALQAPVDLYIYASSQDLHDAILYEPGWTGGQAFPKYNSVIIGIAPDNLDWGRRTVAHELTHVLVGQFTFSCLENMPTWLNEGVAVYGEGGLEAASQAQLGKAVTANQLISVRALSGGFSEHPSQADLSYAQSYSLIHYLVSEFGAEKLRALFTALSQGTKIEDALQTVYSFGLAGLEGGWRASLGAAPHAAAGAGAATPLPSPVPTYPPVSAAARAVGNVDAPAGGETTSAGQPATGQPQAPSGAPAAGSNPLGGLSPLLLAGGAALLVLLVTGLLLWIRQRRNA